MLYFRKLARKFSKIILGVELKDYMLMIFYTIKAICHLLTMHEAYVFCLKLFQFKGFKTCHIGTFFNLGRLI